jgi:RNA recognition motif-containing protein
MCSEASGALIDGYRSVGMPVPHQSYTCLQQRSHIVGTRIYVGNLPYSADNAQLTQMFSAYGDVVDIRVITDRDTGQSKGFAFVEMSTAESARQAIAGLNGTMLDNRALRLDEASERSSGNRGGNGGGHNDRPRGGGW